MKITEHNNPSTINNNNICPSENEIDYEILHDHFEKTWEKYPVKEGKQKAETYYLQWIKGRKINGRTLKLTDQDMWFAVQMFLLELKEKQTDLQFVPHGSTFFNSKIYDYYELWKEKQ